MSILKQHTRQDRRRLATAAGCGTGFVAAGLGAVLVTAAVIPDLSCSLPDLSIDPCDGRGSDLVDAAARGDTDEVRRRLDSGESPARGDNAASPLRCAVHNSHPTTVALLVERGAYASPVDVAEAARIGDVDIARTLLDGGAPAEGAVLAIPAGGSYDDGSFGIHASFPSRDATDEEAVAIATLLLERGADPNGGVQGPSPLLTAAFNGRRQIVALLLAHGADPNHGGPVDRALIEGAQKAAGNPAPLPAPSGASVANVPPIVGAAWTGDLESATLLLDAGADPNLAADDAFTALYGAAVLGNDAMVSLLLEHGAWPVPNVRLGVMAPADAARAANHLTTAALIDSAR
jgi:ankyrin repeat protein